jgi:hypothetical protein
MGHLLLRWRDPDTAAERRLDERGLDEGGLDEGGLECGRPSLLEGVGGGNKVTGGFAE